MVRALAIGCSDNHCDARHNLVRCGIGKIPGLDHFELRLHDGLLLHESALLVLGVLILGIFAQIAIALGELDALDVRRHILVDELEILGLANGKAAVARVAAILSLLLRLDDISLKLGSNSRHSHDYRVVRRVIPCNRRLEALKETNAIGIAEPANDLLKPLNVRKKAAHHVLHLESLSALTALAKRDSMVEKRNERRKLCPILERLVLADNESRKRGGRLGAAHELAHSFAASRILLAIALDELGNSREAEFVKRLVELDAIYLVIGEEVDHCANLTRGKIHRSLDIALAVHEIFAHLIKRRSAKAHFADGNSKAGIERIVNAARSRNGKLESACDLRLHIIGSLFELTLLNELARTGKNELWIGLVRERHEPNIAIIVGGSPYANGIRTADGNLHELILLQGFARSIPELLPVDSLHKTIGDANSLKAHNGHIAVALKNRLHKIGRSILEHRLKRSWICLTKNENMILGGDFKHIYGCVIRELMALAGLEIHRHAAIEVIHALNSAKPPRLAEHQGADREANELLHRHESLVQRLNAKTCAVQKRKKKTIGSRLLQYILDSIHGKVLRKLNLIITHKLERALEILVLGALV